MLHKITEADEGRRLSQGLRGYGYTIRICPEILKRGTLIHNYCSKLQSGQEAVEAI